VPGPGSGFPRCPALIFRRGSVLIDRVTAHRMPRFRTALLAFLGLSACVTYRKPIPELTPLPAAETSEMYRFSDKARQVRLTTLVADLPVGYEFGESAWGFDGPCTRKVTIVNREGRFVLGNERYADVFYSVMKTHGYPVDDQVEMFSNSKEHVAELQVAGRIIELKRNDCWPSKQSDLGMIRGSAYMKIEWSIYSTLEKKVIALMTTEGSTYKEVESHLDQAGYLRIALADAVQRLAISARYREVIDPPR
jgi:hypothetical protein